MLELGTNPKAVELLAHEGPKLVSSFLLEKLAIPFDRQANGDLSLVLEGGHKASTNSSCSRFYRKSYREISDTFPEVELQHIVTHR